jgi:hypothetical protein
MPSRSGQADGAAAEAQPSATIATLALRAPDGRDAVPAFDGGWRREDGGRDAFLSYVQVDHPVNWSEQLEQLHEESSRSHFIDVWTRAAMLSRIGRLPARPVILDLGCSTGYLLEDLRRAQPRSSGVWPAT